MFSVIIVDDEEFVRNGIKNTICWNQLGFDVIGTAENGLAALNLIKLNPPHVILTDVKMPEMDGIELIKTVNYLYPNIKCVLLSAYDDFKYAQSAIKYGAKGYLLKPLEENELKETFLKLAMELEDGNDQNQAEYQVNDLNCNESLSFINEAKKYVTQHYDKKITLEEIAEYLYITPAYFSVTFKRATGQNFIDYVTQVKIEKSKELLKKSMYRIKEVAVKVGYDDYTYFCKVFKKREKITPIEFRSRVMMNK